MESFLPTRDTVSLQMPDYFVVISDSDTTIFNLTLDLAKWNHSNEMTEASHHYIEAAQLDSATAKMLTRVKVSRWPNPITWFFGGDWHRYRRCTAYDLAEAAGEVMQQLRHLVVPLCRRRSEGFLVYLLNPLWFMNSQMRSIQV